MILLDDVKDTMRGSCDKRLKISTDRIDENMVKIANVGFQMFDEARVLRIHPDVLRLGTGLAQDPDKLKAAAPYMFMPAHKTWIEWEQAGCKMGFFFDGQSRNGHSVTHGYGIMAVKRLGHDPEPSLIGTEFSIPDFTLSVNHTMGMEPNRTMAQLIQTGASPLQAMDMMERFKPNISFETQTAMSRMLSLLKPSIWAILALINSPKIIRQQPIDLSRLNKRRLALGRYTFHPHHEVRLNIDKHIIDTVSGEGEGASKCLHFVRTHLRFVPHWGQYTLVHPHWRGDPALGIRDTHYRADRTNSKWDD